MSPRCIQATREKLLQPPQTPDDFQLAGSGVRLHVRGSVPSLTGHIRCHTHDPWESLRQRQPCVGATEKLCARPPKSFRKDFKTKREKKTEITCPN